MGIRYDSEGCIRPSGSVVEALGSGNRIAYAWHVVSAIIKGEVLLVLCVFRCFDCPRSPLSTWLRFKVPVFPFSS